MDPNVKQRWLAALRSGEFRQAWELLRRRADDGYCCLGVLCELYRQDHERTARWEPAGTGYDFAIDDELGDTDWAELPRAVAEWAGLDWTMQGGACYVPALAEKEPNARRRTLAGLNDDGVPFDGIADVIEAHL